ncbi:hypothetical protein [Pyxidicoccus xibeiensis]|uniref:hypothetical protein n=1 Tax=Pyxidicoccus xibeiensis TaxID=2906759 RepID=UPI0020A80D72|nr:hypothetical protein [Pyxidicoccus xibeiensis]MCP3140100.1 hypothetical protein [Pyxidicoccus xibeiensis]
MSRRPPLTMDLPEPREPRLVCPACAQAVPVGPDARCQVCGGSLAETLSAARGPPPPLPPRRLTRAQRRAVLRPKLATHHILGTLFFALGALLLPVAFVFVRPLLLMAAIFLFVGFLFRRSGWPAALRREQRRRLQALRWGLPAAGELTGVERHFLPSLEAGRVARLDYVFTVHGQRVHGSMPSPHLSDLQRRPGAPVWVVYLAEAPDISALWPPEP